MCNYHRIPARISDDILISGCELSLKSPAIHGDNTTAMIEQGLIRYIDSMRGQRMMSFAGTLKLFRFMRTGRQTIVDQDQALLLAKQLTARMGQTRSLSERDIMLINPPLASILAVTGPPFHIVIHTGIVVDREPEAKVAFTLLTQPGFTIVDVQSHLLYEASRGLRPYLFTPEQVPEIKEAFFA